MLELKPIFFRHILRLNPKCKFSTVEKFMKALITEDNIFNLNVLGTPPKELMGRTIKDVKSTNTAARKESRRLVKKYGVDNAEEWCEIHWGVKRNTVSACWLNEYVVTITSKDMLYPAFQRLAKKFRFNMYFSYVENSSINVEENCGIGRVGTKNSLIKLPKSKLVRFVLGTILMKGSPLMFNEWEEETVKGSVAKYYAEHFIQEGAREKIRKAWEGPIGRMARVMVEMRLGVEFPWNELVQYFKAQSN